jgi:ATP-dependent helicase IRC3
MQHKAKKVLILAHRKELLFQPYKHLQRDSPNFKLGFEQGSKKAEIANCDIVLASVQTLGRVPNSNSTTIGRLNKFNPEEFGLIIIGKLLINLDEAHHASAATYQRILEYFGAYDPISPIKVWGCSATLRRHDGVSLSPTFEEVIYDMKIKDLIEKKWFRLIYLI